VTAAARVASVASSERRGVRSALPFSARGELFFDPNVNVGGETFSLIGDRGRSKPTFERLSRGEDPIKSSIEFSFFCPIADG